MKNILHKQIYLNENTVCSVTLSVPTLQDIANIPVTNIVLFRFPSVLSNLVNRRKTRKMAGVVGNCLRHRIISSVPARAIHGPSAGEHSGFCSLITINL
jgi:hypothetical protein